MCVGQRYEEGKEGGSPHGVHLLSANLRGARTWRRWLRRGLFEPHAYDRMVGIIMVMITIIIYVFLCCHKVVTSEMAKHTSGVLCCYIPGQMGEF